MASASMKAYDISLPLSAGLAGWPGDAPFALQWTCTKRTGASVNLGQLSLSIHAGTHVDAPYHYDNRGATVDMLDPAVFVGPACVRDVSHRSIIRWADLDGVDWARAPRLLLRTGGWTDHSRFPERIPVLNNDVPQLLAERGVVLVGVDVPSVDALDSKDLPNHNALGVGGIAILESLNLSHVPEGFCELIALPLRLMGADGSPVRAVLRRAD
jgi:arylformamidase